MVSKEVRLFVGLLLISLGIIGLGFGLSVLPVDFAFTVILIFGSMLIVGVVLYLKAMVTLHRKKKQQPSK